MTVTEVTSLPASLGASAFTANAAHRYKAISAAPAPFSAGICAASAGQQAATNSSVYRADSHASTDVRHG